MAVIRKNYHWHLKLECGKMKRSPNRWESPDPCVRSPCCLFPFSPFVLSPFLLSLFPLLTLRDRKRKIPQHCCNTVLLYWVLWPLSWPMEGWDIRPRFLLQEGMWKIEKEESERRKWKDGRWRRPHCKCGWMGRRDYPRRDMRVAIG